MTNINDRGTIKWTSIMLPEHVRMLDKIFNEPEKKKNKPVLDEQEIQEINMKIHQAIHQNKTIISTYFKNHDYKTISGKLQKVDVMNKCIQLNDEENTKIIIHDIIDVSLEP